MSQLHTCSYYCDRPECIRAQRDELRDKVEALRKDAEREREFICRKCGIRQEMGVRKDVDF